MRNISKYLFLASTFFVISACTNVKKMSDDSRSRLETICMMSPEKIIFPESAIFMSHGQGWAMGIGAGIGGAVGGVIAGASAGSQKSEKQIIADYLNSGPGTFSEKLVTIFSNKMQEKMSYKLSCNAGYDSNVIVMVKQYGISYVPFTKSYRPILTLYAEITDNSGSVIWKNQIAEYSSSKIVEKRRRKEWFYNEDSSSIMKAEFSKLAESILERFALHLSGDYSYSETDNLH